MEAQQMLERQMYAEINNPEQGHGQSAFVRGIEATDDTIDHFNFDVHISGD